VVIVIKVVTEASGSTVGEPAAILGGTSTVTATRAVAGGTLLTALSSLGLLSLDHPSRSAVGDRLPALTSSLRLLLLVRTLLLLIDLESLLLARVPETRRLREDRCANLRCLRHDLVDLFANIVVVFAIVALLLRALTLRTRTHAVPTRTCAASGMPCYSLVRFPILASLHGARNSLVVNLEVFVIACRGALRLEETVESSLYVQPRWRSGQCRACLRRRETHLDNLAHDVWWGRECTA
jgi:hypothetical protein